MSTWPWLTGWKESTLHYFLPGNTHNQVSLSLVDKDLTAAPQSGIRHGSAAAGEVR
jgi:hypothetical protein